MEFLKERRGQGAFEYILLLAGVLLIVVLAIIILRGSVLGAANNQIAAGTNAVGQQTNSTITLCGQYLAISPGIILRPVGAPNTSYQCYAAEDDLSATAGCVFVAPNSWCQIQLG